MSELSQCTHRGIEDENAVFLSCLDHLIIMVFFVDLVFGLGSLLLLLLFCFVLLFDDEKAFCFYFYYSGQYVI